MTTIITAKSLSLTVDADDYNPQTISCELVRNVDRQEFDVLDGTVYKTLKYTGELNIEMFADWGAASSLCEAMWNAADTAPDTPLSCTLVANTGATFTFDVLPAAPAVSGTAPDAMTASFTLTVVDGDITLA